MDDVAAEGGALAETVVFLSYFKDLPDPRQAGKVMYPLAEVLLLFLLAVLAGAETITDIARFGDKKLALLRRFSPFAAGTPAHDHLGDILATLDAEAFQRCFVAWVAALIGVLEGVVAIDGKTVRRSKSAAKNAIHMVSAFAARQRLVLGQVKVADSLPRRRMPPPNRPRPRQLHHPQTHGSQPHPKSQIQGLHPPDRQQLPHQRSDDRAVLRRPHQGPAGRVRHQRDATQGGKESGAQKRAHGPERAAGAPLILLFCVS
jgi:hypothetical protein